MNQCFRLLRQFQVVRFFSLDMPLGSNRVRQQSPVMSDRSGHAQQQGIIRCRAGVGGQGSHEAMESPKALICPLEKGVRGIKISGLCRCSASLTSVSLHGCFAFCGVRLYCSPPWNLITVKSWLNKLSLSVNRWGFTDKLFKINNLSVRRRVFTDEIHSVRQRLTGIAEVLTKWIAEVLTENEVRYEEWGKHRIGLNRTTCILWFDVYYRVSIRYNEQPNAGYVKKWVTWLLRLSCVDWNGISVRENDFSLLRANKKHFR